MTIQVLKAKKSNSKGLKPYILVEIGQDLVTNLALVDIVADINAISYDTMEILGKQMLKWSSATIDTMSGQRNLVEGCLTMDVFIGTTNVHERFFLMKHQSF